MLRKSICILHRFSRIRLRQFTVSSMRIKSDANSNRRGLTSPVVVCTGLMALVQKNKTMPHEGRKWGFPMNIKAKEYSNFGFSGNYVILMEKKTYTPLCSERCIYSPWGISFYNMVLGKSVYDILIISSNNHILVMVKDNNQWDIYNPYKIII